MKGLLTKNAVFSLLLVLISGCASLGAEKPRNLDDGIAYAYAQVTGGVEASTRALNSGVITSSDMGVILNKSEEIRTVLDAAKSASDMGDVTTAQGKLDAAHKLLLEYQSHLASKGVST